MNFYVSVFSGSPHHSQDSRIISVKHYEEGMKVPGMPEMKGKVLTGIFELAGQRFMALDGGLVFKFSEAVSFYVECDTQEELDYFWGKLSADPAAEQCGWLKDRYGLSWQIIPKVLAEYSSDPDPVKANRVINAMLDMKKIDITAIERAYQEP